MKSAFLLTDITLTGGVETVTLTACQNLRAAGIDASIITCRHLDTRAYADYIYPANITNKKLDKYDIRKIIHIIKQYNFGKIIVQLNDPYCFLANSALLKKISNICEVYGTLHNSPLSFMKRYKLYNDSGLTFFIKSIYTLIRYTAASKMFFKQARRYVASFITLSIGCHDEFKKYFSLESLICYNPIKNNAVFSNSVKENIAVFIGRLSREKNIYFLLDAWRKIDTIHQKNWLFQIIGDGEEKNSLMQYTNNHAIKNVTFMGKIPMDEIFNYLAKSQLLLLSSFHEGWPAVICEAMQTRNAIITTKYDGFSAELLRDGETCFVTDFSTDQFSTQLEYLIKNPSALMVMQSNAFTAVTGFYKLHNDDYTRLI